MRERLHRSNAADVDELADRPIPGRRRRLNHRSFARRTRNRCNAVSKQAVELTMGSGSMMGERGVKQSTLAVTVGVVFAVMAAGLLIATVNVRAAIAREQAASSRQAEFKQLAQDLTDATDRLTLEAQLYAVTGDLKHLDAYCCGLPPGCGHRVMPRSVAG
ncbi:hypothetical protein [Dactylosporangium maewongense]